MAEEIDDNRFKSEVMRMLGNLVSKANEHDQRFDKIELKVDRLSADFNLLSNQFDAVGSMAIADHGKIGHLENRISSIEAESH
ncbi:MAG: hypothetical protein ABIV48_01430 [Pyrinomonadaceae bacterium]